MRKSITRLICVIITVCLIAVCFLPAPEVSAAGDTLDIYVAYFGQSYIQPILKRSFTRAELESLGAYTAHFTSVDGGGFSAGADVYGVNLADVLSAAGINYWAASTLNFRTADHTSGYTSLSVGYLFGGRYSFPLLSQYYGTLPGEVVPRFADPENPDIPENEIIDMLWANAVSVSTMLAFSENYGRADDFSPFDGGAQNSEKAYRLFVGQTVPNEAVSSNLASWVESIVVLFPGPPVLSTDENDLNLEIGADYKVRVNVDGGDDLLVQDVLSRLKWESSDSSIVSVDQDGQLTVHQKGTATITVYAEDYYNAGGSKVSLSITINAGTGENLGTGGEGTGGGTGDGSGNGESDGTGDGEESGNGDETESGDTGNGDGSAGDSAADPTQPGDSSATEPSEPSGDDAAEPAETQPQQSESGDPDDPEEDEELYISENQSDTEMKEPDSTASKGLKVKKLILSGSRSQDSPAESAGASGYEGGSEAMLLVEENPLMTFTIIMAIVLFLWGGAWKYIIFRREI